MKAGAMADYGRAGVDGWTSMCSSPTRADCAWFPVAFQHQDIPAELNMHRDLQRSVACFEMLAQTLLLLLARNHWANSSGNIYIPVPGAAAVGENIFMESGNAPTMGATNELFSGRWHMAYFVVNFN